MNSGSPRGVRLAGTSQGGGGEWDGLMRDVLPPVLGAPRVCIEMGSNIGASTVLMKSLFPEVALVCAEPVERYRAYLLENLRPYSHVLHVEDRIIASRSGQTATIQANSTTASASNADYGADCTGRETLFTLSLDDLVEHLGLKGQIDFIKVDTDGYEHEVVSGGRRCLEDDKPLLFVEFCPPALRRVLRSEKELVEVLLEVGCQVFMVYHPNGSFLGVARDYDRIMTLKQNLYYVDLFTLPSRSKHEGAFLDFVTSVESVRARPE